MSNPANLTDVSPQLASDRYFNGALASKLARNIYTTAKGRLRLKIVRERLAADFPLNTPVTVLDAGGGLGQMACWLARQGHQVTLAEPAQTMLDLAAARLERYQVQAINAAIQDLPQRLPKTQQQFDLVVCHAVLEWLQDPHATLLALLQHLKPGGYLSLMFFNADALLLANIVRGNWQRVIAKDYVAAGLRGQGKRLTPINPLQPEQVLSWTQQAGLQVVSITGVRVFNDYLRQNLPANATLTQLIQIERHYNQQEPWWRLGRYILLHLRKPAS